jgi:hypothetical protein
LLRIEPGVLLASVSVFALPVALGPANATGLPPGMALLVEGGGVCPEGEDGTFRASYTYAGVTAGTVNQFGSAGCGWTGRIGLFQDKPGVVFGWGDFWGVFVRHQEFRSSDFRANDGAYRFGDAKYYFAGIKSGGNFDEDRTIVDFEVGKDIGIGSDGSKLRIFGGIRYANYSSTLRALGDTNSNYCILSCKYFSRSFSNPFGVRAGHDFDGIGPRLGATGQLPLFGGLFLTGSISGSLLWGEHRVHLTSFGFGGRSKFSDDDLVSNAEGEVGVGMPFLMTGGRLIVGARWEGWFDQSKFANYKVDLNFDCCPTGLQGTFGGNGTLDRNNWGPFMRLNIPLGPTPPP